MNTDSITKEGVVLASEKRVGSSLLEPSSVEKIMEIDTHIGAAMAGLMPDARTLIEHARVEAQHHRFDYNEPIRVEALTQSICDLALGFGEDGDEKTMSRPFGVALLLAGWDDLGPCLYFSDPSGHFSKFKAKAIGSGHENAQSHLQETYSESFNLIEAENLALSTIKNVMEEKIKIDFVELACVTRDGFKAYGKEEVEAVLERIQ